LPKSIRQLHIWYYSLRKKVEIHLLFFLVKTPVVYAIKNLFVTTDIKHWSMIISLVVTGMIKLLLTTFRFENGTEE